jgi:hypothetical protein
LVLFKPELLIKKIKIFFSHSELLKWESGLWNTLQKFDAEFSSLVRNFVIKVQGIVTSNIAQSFCFEKMRFWGILPSVLDGEIVVFDK